MASGGSKATTICAYCDHRLHWKDGVWVSLVTYSRFCAANPDRTVIDHTVIAIHKPVSGESR